MNNMSTKMHAEYENSVNQYTAKKEMGQIHLVLCNVGEQLIKSDYFTDKKLYWEEHLLIKRMMKNSKGSAAFFFYLQCAKFIT